MNAPGPGTEAVFDTSVWIALFNDETRVAHLAAAAGVRRAVTTPIVLAELVANSKRGRIKHANPLADVETHARYEPLTREDVLAGGEQLARLRGKGRNRVGLGDCLIHATARRIGAALVTADSDLEGEPGVIFLKP